MWVLAVRLFAALAGPDGSSCPIVGIGLWLWGWNRGLAFKACILPLTTKTIMFVGSIIKPYIEITGNLQK